MQLHSGTRGKKRNKVNQFFKGAKPKRHSHQISSNPLDPKLETEKPF
jgi:hypothetical protein